MKFSKAKQTEMQLQELQGYVDAVKAFLDKPIGKGHSKQDVRKELAALKVRLESLPMYICPTCTDLRKTIEGLRERDFPKAEPTTGDNVLLGELNLETQGPQEEVS